MTFQQDLASLLNRYSLENGSNTPDWLMAGYLYDCLLAFNSALRRRERWCGRSPDEPASAPTGPLPEVTLMDTIQSTVITWDYRQQPNWVEIQAGLHLYAHPQITVVEDTGDDQHAVIISGHPFSQAAASARYSLQ